MAKVKIWPNCELKVDRRFFVFEEEPVLAEDAIMLMNRREEKFAKKLIHRTFFCSPLCAHTMFAQRWHCQKFFCRYLDFARHTIFYRCLVLLYPTTLYQRERKRERVRERETRIDNIDSPIVDFAQLATDSRGRRRVEGTEDQCLLSKLSS